MNPCDPLEHFDLCADCGSVILGNGECQSCPVETVRVPDSLMFGACFIMIIFVLFMMFLVAQASGYLGWTRYLSEFGHFLKGGK